MTVFQKFDLKKEIGNQPKNTRILSLTAKFIAYFRFMSEKYRKFVKIAFHVLHFRNELKKNASFTDFNQKNYMFTQ